MNRNQTNFPAVSYANLMIRTNKSRVPLAEIRDGILGGDRVWLSRGITLIESKLAADQPAAEQLLHELLPHTGKSMRIGITGVPGAGKSTFIDSFGTLLTAAGETVAVLAVDPSSQLSRGSILGDKTRMAELARNPNAFVRPSPARGTLGGVAGRTRETMLLCEAAGFSTIIVETVGVGQSETLVREMVDFFLLLMLPGAGDELQGIKKGIMEMADALVINKADGDNLKSAKKAEQEYKQALHLFPPNASGWQTRVSSCSALESRGLKEIWDTILEFRQKMNASGYIGHLRTAQDIGWMQNAVDAMLKEEFDRLVKQEKELIVRKVASRECSPLSAAKKLFEVYSSEKLKELPMELKNKQRPLP